jgi:hypothetical protein
VRHVKLPAVVGVKIVEIFTEQLWIVSVRHLCFCFLTIGGVRRVSLALNVMIGLVGDLVLQLRLRPHLFQCMPLRQRTVKLRLKVARRLISVDVTAWGCAEHLLSLVSNSGLIVLRVHHLGLFLIRSAAHLDSFDLLADLLRPLLHGCCSVYGYFECRSCI